MYTCVHVHACPPRNSLELYPRYLQQHNVCDPNKLKPSNQSPPPIPLPLSLPTPSHQSALKHLQTITKALVCKGSPNSNAQMPVDCRTPPPFDCPMLQHHHLSGETPPATEGATQGLGYSSMGDDHVSLVSEGFKELVSEGFKELVGESGVARESEAAVGMWSNMENNGGGERRERSWPGVELTRGSFEHEPHFSGAILLVRTIYWFAFLVFFCNITMFCFAHMLLLLSVGGSRCVFVCINATFSRSSAQVHIRWCAVCVFEHYCPLVHFLSV